MPVKGKLYGVVGQQGLGEMEGLPGAGASSVLPFLRLPVDGDGINMCPGGEVVGVGLAQARDAGFVDVEEEFDDRISQCIGAVVDIGDLLAAADVAVGGHGIDGYRISATVLPIVGPGAAVGGAGTFFIGCCDIAGGVEGLA